MSTRHETSQTGEQNPHDQVSGALDELQRLEANWNGYGAAPIDPDTIASANRLAKVLQLQDAGVPQVVPMTQGRLQLEWHRGARSLELELESPTMIRYLKWDSDQGISEEDSLPIADVGRVQELVAWFVAG